MDPGLESTLLLDRPIPDVFDVEPDIIERRATQYAAVDPFPNVPAALLGVPDLLDYVAATGMVHPFRIDMTHQDKTLKPATYGVPVLGPYVYWRQADRTEQDMILGQEPRYEKHSGTLAAGERLTLHPNTITFVTLEPAFRFPRYIAARFNLNIRDIYRGILVGTGPLVDPGFHGPLSVPLHNLTSNEYTIVGGEELVWMEFTKLSSAPDRPDDGWRSARPHETPDRRGFYISLPERKIDVKLEEYINRGHSGPVVSSISAAVGRAQHAALAARSDAESSRKALRNWGLGGLAAIVVGLGAILVPTWNLINDESARRDDVAQRVAQLEDTVVQQRGLIASQDRTVRQQAANIRRQGAQIARQRRQISALQTRGAG